MNAPHPNGSAPRPLSVGKAKMPKQSKQAPIRHTALNVGEGSNGLGQMPKKTAGRTECNPRIS